MLPFLYLSDRDVYKALPMTAAVEMMREAFTHHAQGSVLMPPRTCLNIPDTQGLMALMPCYAGELTRMSVKIISQFVQPPGSDLPLIQAIVLLADATDGRLLALMNGAAITAVRTGAAAGVATDILARADASVAAVFGAGVQARTQLEAMCTVRAIHTARVFDTNTEAAQRFASEMSGRLGIPVTVAESPAAALEEATVVCTATTSATPLFDDADLVAGAHVNAVGAWRPDRFVDQYEAALEEAGDLIMPMRARQIDRGHIRGELGELLVGTASGRLSPDDVTVFKSVGIAMQDVYAASRAYDNACQRGIGVQLDR
jgi:ornithine cyclodeaminase/alanine dehydrogenase-like protein (mu-crystallin family)